MIRKLSVRNFRSLKELDIELRPRNLLVGPNMAGKSNIIDVFKFLSAMVLPRPGSFGLPGAFDQRSGFQEVLWKGIPAGAITIGTRWLACRHSPTARCSLMSLCGERA